MTRERGPHGPHTSFSEDTARRIDPELDPDASASADAEAGCLYETPAGRCGDRGTRVTVAGVRVTLCNGHLDAVLHENGLAAPPRSPRGRLARRAEA